MAGSTTWVVTGASRGLGLEMTKQLVEAGHRVAATARTPEKASALQELAAQHPNLTLITLDVLDSESVEAFAVEVGKLFPGGLDVLINNAGMASPMVPAAESDPASFPPVFRTNILGCFLVIKALLPLIRKGTKKQIVQISSTMGSIGSLQKILRSDGEQYSQVGRYALPYRCSKAALNMETVSLAVDLKPENITVVAMCPGWVDTDMGSGAAVELANGSAPDLKPPESVAAQLKVIAGLTPDKTGSFFSHEGEVIPW